MKTYKICQSCGFPLKKDKLGGGSEIDGSISLKYCSMCYINGSFVNPEIDTALKMQKFCIKEMQRSGIPFILSYLATRVIPKLERWNK